MSNAIAGFSRPVVIAGYARSAFAPALKGSLARVRPDELAAEIISKLITRTQVNPQDIEDVIIGCAFPEGEQGLNIARMISLLAGLPITAGAQTVNRFCGSSMSAIHIAAGAIQLQAGEAFICAGIESMSRVPMNGFNPLPSPKLFGTMPQAYMGMGDTAENVARKWEISRLDQDGFALASHRKAASAQQAGRLSDEIVPVFNGKNTVGTDECIRADTSADALSALRPAFDKTGSVTAGSASPLTDGAAAVLVCSEDYARRNGLNMLARIISVAVCGCAPEIMGVGPIGATKKALLRAGITAGDLSVVELNEAFASQSLAVIRELGLDPATVNIDGGAIALGHPLGATGARITGKAAALLKREGGRYALATQCIGGGQGIATVLEAI